MAKPKRKKGTSGTKPATKSAGKKATGAKKSGAAKSTKKPAKASAKRATSAKTRPTAKKAAKPKAATSAKKPANAKTATKTSKSKAASAKKAATKPAEAKAFSPRALVDLDAIRGPIVQMARAAGAPDDVIAALSNATVSETGPRLNDSSCQAWTYAISLFNLARGTLAPLADRLTDDDRPWAVLLRGKPNHFGFFEKRAFAPEDRPDADIDDSDRVVGQLFLYDSRDPNCDYGWDADCRPVDVASANPDARRLLEDGWPVTVDGRWSLVAHEDAAADALYRVDLDMFNIHNVGSVPAALAALAARVTA